MGRKKEAEVAFIPSKYQKKIFDFVENGGSRHVGVIADLHRFPPRRSAMAHSRTARRGPAGGVQSRADISCNAVRIRW